MLILLTNVNGLLVRGWLKYLHQSLSPHSLLDHFSLFDLDAPLMAIGTDVPYHYGRYYDNEYAHHAVG